MANTIKLKRSSTASDTPSASDLEVGELAINTADAKLFTKHTDNSIKEISGSGGDVVDDTSPELGGDLQSNGNDIDLADNDILRLGSGDDAEFFVNGSHLYLDLNSGIGNFYIRDGSTTRYTFNDNGNFTATGNVTAYSDRRVKAQFEPIIDALSKVQQLHGQTYIRTDMDDANRRYAGLIAQDVELVLPEAVSEVDEHLALDYSGTIALLVEAIKDLKAEVDELKTKLEAA